MTLNKNSLLKESNPHRIKVLLEFFNLIFFSVAKIVMQSKKLDLIHHLFMIKVLKLKFCHDCDRCKIFKEFPGGQWLGFCASTACGTDSVPGRRLRSCMP